MKTAIAKRTSAVPGQGMKLVQYSMVLCLAILLLSGSPTWSRAADCGEDGVQQSGSIYRICMPAAGDYNGSLVIWAHGFQDATEPVRIPEEQLVLGGLSIPEIITGMGFGFATNSYSKTGLAVLQGMDDLTDLVTIYSHEQGPPENVYIVGASEGGLITTLLVEQRPDIFDAGLAVCGPVGDFPFQISYFGDARATFAYFFPNLIPGDPFAPSQGLIDSWPAYYENVVKPVVFAPVNRRKLNQWVRVAKLPFDVNNYLPTVEEAVRDVLRYSVINMTDAAETLGGFPFDNQEKQYKGSYTDTLLNIMVPRVSADQAAITEMKSFYNTGGQLQNPVITLHTLYDQQVPYAHEILYNMKTALAGSLPAKHLNIPVVRFGHCNVNAAEALTAFAVMLRYAGYPGELAGVGAVLQGETLVEFERLAVQQGLAYKTEGDALRLGRNHR